MRYFALLVMLGVCALVGCNKLYPVDVGVSQGKGVVRRVDYEHAMITLDHGTVPKLVTGMTFAYRVQNDTLMHGILPEDTVLFTLNEQTPGTFVVQSIKKLSGPKVREVPIFPDEIATVTKTVSHTVQAKNQKK